MKIFENGENKEVPGIPYTGMPATYVIGSDQYAGKLIAVSRTGHRVTWQRDGNAGMVHEMTLRAARGEYMSIGSRYGYLKLGVAKTALDPGF